MKRFFFVTAVMCLAFLAPHAFVVAQASPSTELLFDSGNISSTTGQPTDYSQNPEYGKACAGVGFDNTGGTPVQASGVCVRASICTDARRIAPVTSGTNCSFADGGVCCASYDIPSAGQGSTANPSGNTANTGGALYGTPSYGAAPATGGWFSGKQQILRFGLPNRSIGAIIQAFVFWLLMLLGFASIIAFIWAGFKYLMAAGDEKQAGEAKAAIKFSVYGIVAALSGVVIIQAVTAMLNATGQF